MNDVENISLYAFRKFGDTVLKTAFACSGNYSEAEDIVQEVFLILHSKPQNFNDDNHLKAWLLRTTINKCRNLKKSFRISRTSSIESLNEAEISCEFTSLDNDIRDMISGLPEKYSSVLYLYYYEEYNIREIAELLGKNENTVSSLLRRARKKMKIELDAAFEADEISQLEALIFKGANDYTTLEADVTTHYVVPAYESNTGRLYHVQVVGKIYRNVPEGKFYMTLEGERSDSSNPIIVELVCDGINQVQYTEKDKTTGEINVQYEYQDVPGPMQNPTFDYFRLDERVIFFIQRYKERPEEKRKFEVTNGIPITNAYSGSNYYSFSYKEDDGNEYYMRVIVNENGQIIHCDYSYDYSGVQVNLGSNGEIKIDSPDFKMPDIVG